MHAFLLRFWHDETAASALDYTLLASLGIVGTIGSLQMMTETMDQLFAQANTALTAALARINAAH